MKFLAIIYTSELSVLIRVSVGVTHIPRDVMICDPFFINIYTPPNFYPTTETKILCRKL